MDNLRFEEMNLSPELFHAVNDLGFEEATPIQAQSIDIIRQGQDILGQSQTGTGKTLAFGIPVLEMIDPDDRRLQAVILSPTRELAIQISEEFRKLLKYKENIRVLPIYGGQPIDRQIMALKKGVQVIIGTPGRVMDHMSRRTLKMDSVKFVVLDEADEMLDMGFREDIEEILSKIPSSRQTILFSATMPNGIIEIANSYLNSPQHVKIARRELTVPSIEQIYFEVRNNTKLSALCRLIDMYNPDSALIFCNTKKQVDDLVEQLQGRGYFAEGLHGDLKQPQRDKVMGKFKNRTLEILVATDVAARGIDVYNIDIVINYDVPQDEEYYVHRIGRTGRAGKSGRAFTFVVGKEIYKLKDIMYYTHSKIVPMKLPTLSDIEESKTADFVNSIRTVIEEGHLAKYVNIVEKMMNDDYASIDIAAALMKMSLSEIISVDEKDFSDDVEFSYADFMERTTKDKDGKKFVKLLISAGSKHGIRAKDIVGAIAGEASIPGKAIGAIDVYDDHAFVDIPKKYVKDVLSAMKGKRIKGNIVVIEQVKDASEKSKSNKSYKKDKEKNKKRAD